MDVLTNEQDESISNAITDSNTSPLDEKEQTDLFQSFELIQYEIAKLLNKMPQPLRSEVNTIEDEHTSIIHWTPSTFRSFIREDQF